MAQPAPVYLYSFEWDTPIVDGTKAIKAFHTAELPLAMRLVKYPESEPVSKQIAGAWAAFAKSGNPESLGLAQLAEVRHRRRAPRCSSTCRARSSTIRTVSNRRS